MNAALSYVARGRDHDERGSRYAEQGGGRCPPSSTAPLALKRRSFDTRSNGLCLAPPRQLSHPLVLRRRVVGTTSSGDTPCSFRCLSEARSLGDRGHGGARPRCRRQAFDCLVASGGARLACGGAATYALSLTRLRIAAAIEGLCFVARIAGPSLSHEPEASTGVCHGYYALRQSGLAVTTSRSDAIGVSVRSDDGGASCSRRVFPCLYSWALPGVLFSAP